MKHPISVMTPERIPKIGKNQGLEKIKEGSLSLEEKIDLILELVATQQVVQEVYTSKEPLPVMCTRQRLPKYFPGQCAQTWANLASQKRGPKYWRRGKTCWYSVQEVRDYLTENPIQTVDGSSND